MYRSDIDGLRAISALAIFAFHLGISGFSGGFVGVDIFFVISGYLIVPRIVDGLEAGNFSLADFFERRARRILPALFLIILFSLVVGFFILGPREFHELGLSVFATLAFGANFFFHDRSDYFADAAHQKPLLHAWSLGVEEQFYILIPLILMGVWWAFRSSRRLSLRRMVLLITVASFLYNVVFVRLDESHAFYMPMSRFWELGLGGLLALYTRDQVFGRGLSRAAAALGLLLIVVSIFLIDDRVRYPGEAALLPVLGSALLIFAGQGISNPLSRFLGAAPFRYVGRISYSLYLIHWPIIVFARIYLSRPLEPLEQAVLFVFGVVWAILSWEFFEKAILARGKLAFRPVFTGLAAVGVAMLVLSGVVVQTDGLPGRMSDRSVALIQSLEQEKQATRKAVCDETVTFGDDRFRKFRGCQVGPEEGSRVLFWGDSHSGMVFKAYRALQEEAPWQVLSVGMPDCPPIVDIVTTRRKNRELCPGYVDLIVDHIEKNGVEVVVLGSRWANLASDFRAPGDGGRSHTIFDTRNENSVMDLGSALIRTIDRIEAAGARVIVIGPVPEIQFHVPDTLIRTWSGIGDLPLVRREDFDDRQSRVLAALKRIEILGKATVIYPHQMLCDDVSCDVTRNDKALYTDDDHLSVEGARAIVDELVTHF
ncbi:acyltransferase family protein [Sneathiella chinensis]|uniref:Acyltransferase n=1 Tax=Sneathiella chinensis TaxID=349750 RepID=A0ABQ5U5K2_9PROT|nr:acyltransferase family protein [Sneathiella chinensis]GLQ07184.1 acyltransferase [Sneathiella chinensis]